jgi:uncharacterized protein YggE
MRTITVTGHGVVRVPPDSALVRASVVHRAATVADAVAGCDAGLRLAAEVARQHTEPGLVRTQGLHVGPAWSDDGRPSGFEAQHALRIGVADLTSAGALVGDLAEQVGDRLRVDHVSLEVSDPEASRIPARDAAYADAVTRATQLAGLAGGTLGETQSVFEELRADGWREAAYDGRRMLAAEVSLEPGESEIGVSLTVSFQLL